MEGGGHICRGIFTDTKLKRKTQFCQQILFTDFIQLENKNSIAKIYMCNSIAKIYQKCTHLPSIFLN